jgi:hypothetical protein
VRREELTAEQERVPGIEGNGLWCYVGDPTHRCVKVVRPSHATCQYRDACGRSRFSGRTPPAPFQILSTGAGDFLHSLSLSARLDGRFFTTKNATPFGIPTTFGNCTAWEGRASHRLPQSTCATAPTQRSMFGTCSAAFRLSQVLGVGRSVGSKGPHGLGVHRQVQQISISGRPPTTKRRDAEHTRCSRLALPSLSRTSTGRLCKRGAGTVNFAGYHLPMCEPPSTCSTSPVTCGASDR